VELKLSDSVQTLSGVGPARLELLRRLGIATVEDLLNHQPRRYEDRRQVTPISDASIEAARLFQGRVLEFGMKGRRRGTVRIFEMVAEDDSGRARLRWWNGQYMEGRFEVGDTVVFFGKAKRLKPVTLEGPDIEVIEDAATPLGIRPVYPLTEGLSQNALRGLISRTLDDAVSVVEEPFPSLDMRPWPSRQTAFRWLHRPEEAFQPELAIERLALDELLALRIDLLRRRRRLRARGSDALKLVGDNRWVALFLRELGFELTDSQTSVLRDIRKDFESGLPMRRLLHGDVGSGKTVVAAAASLICLEAGRNVMVMAPTEVLSRQLYRLFERWFAPHGLWVGLRVAGSEMDFDPESPGVLVGTTALISASFRADNVGLVIIDEQHRFGAMQRVEALRKAGLAHLLVMSATPIPRTLALTVYGDLDRSTLSGGPSGRGQVTTHLRDMNRLPRIFDFIRAELEQGRQAFFVFPRIDDDSESSEHVSESVTARFEEIKSALSPSGVAMAHGRMDPLELERVFTAFCEKRVSALVSTTVIEVGVDIPNATVVVVFEAERFGLAQLHQLRGRVGRSSMNGYCILLTSTGDPATLQRLEIFASTNDGFEIAALDLKWRGPGEMLGWTQSGRPPFRFLDLIEHERLVEQATWIVGDGEL